MTYDPKNELNVTIGFSTTNKFMSRVIRWVTRAKCSHAWFAFYDKTLGMRMVMQAEWWGYEIRPWARWLKENTLVAEFEPQGVDLANAVRRMARELGTSYDWGSAAWVGIKGWLKRLMHIGRTLRPSRTPHQLMCSEAVVRLLRHGGVSLGCRVSPELVSPGELMGLLETSKGFVQTV